MRSRYWARPYVCATLPTSYTLTRRPLTLLLASRPLGSISSLVKTLSPRSPFIVGMLVFILHQICGPALLPLLFPRKARFAPKPLVIVLAFHLGLLPLSFSFLSAAAVCLSKSTLIILTPPAAAAAAAGRSVASVSRRVRAETGAAACRSSSRLPATELCRSSCGPRALCGLPPARSLSPGGWIWQSPGGEMRCTHLRGVFNDVHPY